jgi:hypothetical protein
MDFIKNFFYHTDTTNYIRLLRNDNGYDLFMKSKAEMTTLNRKTLVLLSCLIAIGLLVHHVLILPPFILLIIQIYYTNIKIKAVEEFIELCKGIVNFEDYCKVILKLPGVDKQYLYDELRYLTGPLISKKDDWEMWLTYKIQLFKQFFDEYERSFCIAQVRLPLTQ